MKSFFKNIEMSKIHDRVSDLKNQVEDIRFRKPWTTSRDKSPLLLIAFGAGLAAVGVALYKNRSQVAKLCSQCGDAVRDRINGMTSSEYIKEPTNRY